MDEDRDVNEDKRERYEDYLKHVHGNTLEARIFRMKPAIQPAWMKHDRQCLRFYMYYQEPVVENVSENYRIRSLGTPEKRPC